MCSTGREDESRLVGTGYEVIVSCVTTPWRPTRRRVRMLPTWEDSEEDDTTRARPHKIRSVGRRGRRSDVRDHGSEV